MQITYFVDYYLLWIISYGLHDATWTNCLKITCFSKHSGVLNTNMIYEMMYRVTFFFHKTYLGDQGMIIFAIFKMLLQK